MLRCSNTCVQCMQQAAFVERMHACSPQHYQLLREYLDKFNICCNHDSPMLFRWWTGHWENFLPLGALLVFRTVTILACEAGSGRAAWITTENCFQRSCRLSRACQSHNKIYTCVFLSERRATVCKVNESWETSSYQVLFLRSFRQSDYHHCL